jgi:hypothetical protein
MGIKRVQILLFNAVLCRFKGTVGYLCFSSGEFLI